MPESPLPENPAERDTMTEQPHDEHTPHEAVHTFLTPEPIALDIRNAAGVVTVQLTDTATTSVRVSTASSHPLGFLDDMVKSLAGGRFQGLGRGRGFGLGAGLFGDQMPSGAGDAAGAVRVEHLTGEHAAVLIDSNSGREGWRVAFTIEVTAPSGSDVRVKSQSSAVTVTGVAGSADVRTASGDVQLDRTQRKAFIQTASGDVAITAAGGQIDIRTASGTVEVGPVGGDALIHSTSGDIRLGAVAGNISVRSVSGDVQVADAVAGQAEVDAVSGDVRIGVHAGSVASVNLTTFSGSTDTEFEVTGQAPDGDAPVLDIRVSTTSGDIRLHRAA